MKSTMTGRGGTTIKRIQRFAHVHISKFSQDLEQAIITGQTKNVHDAVDEFMGELFIIQTLNLISLFRYCL